MTTALWYALVGVILLAIGFASLILTPGLLRKIIALNIMSSGTFLILVSLARRSPDPVTQAPDPVPQAMVLTGIVVSVSATAMGLAFLLRYYEATGRLALPEDDLPAAPAPRHEEGPSA
ncbi:MAG: monovalent cation/H+ antiporter subunit C [Candidatus Ozemobacter sibiricus]|uniref:Monovalent cation/H+ antiporter subunit C n=1 Tax=Candidatus Ozemobacter sibiricus TaxID=2268124 RepID=A0A367ZIK0_9BACT|nr:MAG: monovalent cation/H+ antiporter subunit C [Candidatus Ozemobacter sibiricus]